MDSSRTTEQSDESDIDLLELNDPGRDWRNSPQPPSGEEPKAAKRISIPPRTSSLRQEDLRSRRQHRDLPTPAQFQRSPREREAATDEEGNGPGEPEIPYLSEVAEEHRDNVKLILSLDAPMREKLDSLEELVVLKVHRKYEGWLNEQENTADFVKLLPNNCKAMATKWEATKNVSMLEPLVKRDGSERAKEAYLRWKIRHGLDNESPQASNNVKSQEAPPEEVDKDGKPPKKDRRAGDIKQGKRLKGRQRGETRDRSKPRYQKHSRSTSRRKYGTNKNEPKNHLPERETARRPTENKVESDGDGYDTAAEAREDSGLFPEYMAPEVNVVLLGSTGVGKSTIINAMANWFAHRNLEDARENPLVLINAEFNHISEDKVSHPIKFDANYSKETVAKSTEHFSTGESVTQYACSYTFEVGIKKRIIRIIDTPGVNDTRGVAQDTKNFTEIVNYLGQFKKIDAFIFLLKPNETRLDLHFRYSMNELLTHLHSSAAENIIFCMSNGKATNYKPGETYGVLTTYLNEIHEKQKIKIATEGRIFVYDSEVFRYICAYNNAIQFTNKEIKQIKASWENGRTELTRMLQHISTLTPHDVINTLSVTKVRRAIERLAGPLAEMSKNHTENMQLIEAQRQHLERCMAAGVDLTGKLHAEVLHMETEELKDPMTVCAHRNCITRQELHPYGAKEVVYTQECHKNCVIPNVKVGEYPNENIKECEIFAEIDNENICSICRHGFEHHLHLKYRLVRRVVRIPNIEISEALAKNNDQIAIAEAFIAEREQQRLQYRKDLEQKQTTCAHFAVFLKENGIVHYNDQYLVYLNKQIREIEEHSDSDENPELLNRLMVSRDQYQALVKIFQDSVKTNGTKSVEEIEEMLNKLETMPDGQLLADIQAIEQHAVDTAHLPNAPVIRIDERKPWDRLKDKVKKDAKKVFGVPPKPRPRCTKPTTYYNDYDYSGPSTSHSFSFLN